MEGLLDEIKGFFAHDTVCFAFLCFQHWNVPYMLLTL